MLYVQKILKNKIKNSNNAQKNILTNVLQRYMINIH